jgi:two-component system response regulator QseB
MRILIVEDATRLAALLAEALAKHGFARDRAPTLSAATDALAAAAYDAVVLDLGLPDGDGLEWLKRRRSASLPPVLALTARGTLTERVAGLDAGVDDYLTKPFAADEVAARLRALAPPWSARCPNPLGRTNLTGCGGPTRDRQWRHARSLSARTGSLGIAVAPRGRRRVEGRHP